jgi:hypothetical protein
MRRFGFLFATVALLLGIAATPVQARPVRQPQPPQPQPTWTYDPVVAFPTPGPASCPVSGTTGNATTVVDQVALSGTGNQEPTIERAIDSVESRGGGIVELPSGTWTIDSGVDVLSNVTLEGPATLKAGSTFLYSKGPYGGYPMVYANDAENVTVANLTLDQQSQTLNAVNVSGRMNEMMLEDGYSSNVLFYNDSTEDPFSYSIGELDATQFCFSGDTTQVNTSGRYTQLDGIHMTDGSKGDVTDDHADQCNGTDGDDAIALQAWGGSVSNINIYDDVACSGSTTTLKLAETETGDSIYDVQADGNLFENSPGGVYTGYYPDGGSVYDVNIYSNTFSGILTGNAADITAPSGGSVTDFVLENNCGATGWNLASGAGNVNSGNTSTC